MGLGPECIVQALQSLCSRKYLRLDGFDRTAIYSSLLSRLVNNLVKKLIRRRSPHLEQAEKITLWMRAIAAPLSVLYANRFPASEQSGQMGSRAIPDKGPAL